MLKRYFERQMVGPVLLEGFIHDEDKYVENWWWDILAEYFTHE